MSQLATFDCFFMTLGNLWGTGPILLECGKIAFTRTIGSLQRRSFGAAKLFHAGSWSGCWQHRGSSHHNSFLLESWAMAQLSLRESLWFEIQIVIILDRLNSLLFQFEFWVLTNPAWVCFMWWPSGSLKCYAATRFCPPNVGTIKITSIKIDYDILPNFQSFKIATCWVQVQFFWLHPIFCPACPRNRGKPPRIWPMEVMRIRSSLDFLWRTCIHCLGVLIFVGFRRMIWLA